MGTTNSKSSLAIVSLVALATASTSTNSVVVDAVTRPFAATATAFVPKTRPNLSPTARLILNVRGGDDATITGESETAAPAEEKSLDEKVYAAMEKLGLSAPSADDDESEMDCKDGVCAMPGQKDENGQQITHSDQDPVEIADRISEDMSIDSYMAMAAVGATSTIAEGSRRIFDESAARAMIQQELDLIAMIPEDSESVQTLIGEGFDVFMTRRALAFSENNVDDARAILLAEQMDAEEEEQEEEAARAAASAPEPPVDDFSFEPMAATTTVDDPTVTSVETTEMKSADFVEVNGANFDPTKIPASAPTKAPAPATSRPKDMPKAARKEDVVFEATTDQIQELVLESDVPVLLDIYADWCGPCKALTPALEDMAVQSGGMFRLVKINSDNERPVSQALEVTGLPTVLGISEGKIVHMFTGMPKNEEMMRNFMMGLFGAAPFSPAVTADEKEKYEMMTTKLIKAASAASFSFSARERLTDQIVTKMDKIVNDDSVADVESSATLIRTFLSNIINSPYEAKFRKINLANKVVAAKIGQNASCLAVLKSVGFRKSGSEMLFRADKKVINIAPLTVARDTIDKWIQRNRKEMATAARKRKDELDRANLVFEEVEEESEEEEEVEEIDPTACKLKLRLDGKNKVHDATLHQDDPLTKILEELNVNMEEEEIQITCAAKRLVVKSSDKEAMAKTLGEHGLLPAANVVVKVGTSTKADTSNIKERAAGRKVKKIASMHSIGAYSTEDNNKSNVIDGGGGVMYEYDITDDEDEGEEAKDDGKDDAEASSSKESPEEEPVETEESATPDEE